MAPYSRSAQFDREWPHQGLRHPAAGPVNRTDSSTVRGTEADAGVQAQRRFRCGIHPHPR